MIEIQYSGSQPFISHGALLIIGKSGGAPGLRGQTIYGHNFFTYLKKNKSYIQNFTHFYLKINLNYIKNS